MTQKTKNDGLVNFFSALLKKNAVLPEDTKTIVASIEKLSEELIKLSKTMSSLIVTVYDHGLAINDLYNAQLLILQHLKSQEIEPTIVSDTRPDKFKKPN